MKILLPLLLVTCTLHGAQASSQTTENHQIERLFDWSKNSRECLNVISWLNKHPEDIGVVDKGGNTLLHHALYAGTLLLADWLIEREALKNPLNNNQKTPLDLSRLGLDSTKMRTKGFLYGIL